MPHPENKLTPSRAGNKPEDCRRRKFLLPYRIRSPLILFLTTLAGVELLDAKY
jgi:hypothetical protein